MRIDCLALIFAIACPLILARSSDKVLLSDVKALTFQQDKWTTARRSSPVPQLTCVGSDACGSLAPKVVQCLNQGSDGVDVQWACNADLDSHVRFGPVTVNCEGYRYADDPYVLAGSCGLEYTLYYTASANRHNRDDRSQNTWRSSNNWWNNAAPKFKTVKTDFLSTLFWSIVFILAVYMLTKSSRSTTPTQGTPVHDHQSFFDQHRSTSPPPSPSGSSWQGFWPGFGIGSIFGSFFGPRNGPAYEHQRNSPPRSWWSWSQPSQPLFESRSFWRSSTTQHTTPSSPPRETSSSRSTTPFSSRIATGYGGTRRR